MKPTHTRSRGSMVRRNPAPVPRPHHIGCVSRQVGGRQDGGIALARPHGRPEVGQAARAAGGPGEARPLDLSRGHITYSKRAAYCVRDVNLLSFIHGHPDNHGAAARAAQGRVGGVCSLARYLAQCADGCGSAGLPGWAHSAGFPAVTSAWRGQSQGPVAGPRRPARSVTRYENRHAGRVLGRGSGAARSGGAPARFAKAVRGSGQSEVELPLWEQAAVAEVPWQALGASCGFRKGVAHG